MDLNKAEAELLRLWRETDERGRIDIMRVAQFEAEAARGSRNRLESWRVIDGGARQELGAQQ